MIIYRFLNHVLLLALIAGSEASQDDTSLPATKEKIVVGLQEQLQGSEALHLREKQDWLDYEAELKQEILDLRRRNSEMDTACEYNTLKQKIDEKDIDLELIRSQVAAANVQMENMRRESEKCRATIEYLDKREKDLEAENANLKTEATTFRSQADEYGSALNQSNERLSVLQIANDELTKKHSNAEAQLHQVRELHASVEEKTKQLLLSKEVDERHQNEANQRHEAALKELETSRRNLSLAEGEISALLENIQSMSAQAEQQEARLLMSADNLDVAREEARNAKLEVERMGIDLESTSKKLQENQRTSPEALEGLRTLLDQTNERLIETQSQRARAADERDQLKHELEQVMQKEKTSNENNEALKLANQESKELLIQAYDRLKAAQAENEEADIRVNEAVEGAKQSVKYHFEARINELESLHAAASADMESLGSKTGVLETTVNELSKRNVEIEQSLSACEEQSLVRQNELSVLHHEMASLLDTNHYNAVELDEVKDLVQNLEAEKRQLAVQLEEASNVTKVAEGVASNLQKELDRLTNESKLLLESETSKCKEEVNQVIRSKEQLEHTLFNTEHKAADLAAQIDGIWQKAKSSQDEIREIRDRAVRTSSKLRSDNRALDNQASVLKTQLSATKEALFDLRREVVRLREGEEQEESRLWRSAKTLAVEYSERYLSKLALLCSKFYETHLHTHSKAISNVAIEFTAQCRQIMETARPFLSLLGEAVAAEFHLFADRVREGIESFRMWADNKLRPYVDVLEEQSRPIVEWLELHNIGVTARGDSTRVSRALDNLPTRVSVDLPGVETLMIESVEATANFLCTVTRLHEGPRPVLYVFEEAYKNAATLVSIMEMIFLLNVLARVVSFLFKRRRKVTFKDEK